jgi:class 3 adenylate cyclase
MVTANLLSPLDEPVQAAVAGALDMVAAAQTVRDDWAVRIGIDFGPVSAGIMGKRQFQFDVWGDTVNTAPRIEEYGRPGSVNVSGRGWLQLRNRAQGRSLRLVDLKGKEKIEWSSASGCGNDRSRAPNRALL